MEMSEEQVMIWFNKTEIYYLRNSIPKSKKATGSGIELVSKFLRIMQPKEWSQV